MKRFTSASLAGAAALLLAVTACQERGETTEGAATDTTAAAPAPTTPAAASGQLLDPNSASREELATVPNVSPAIADSLVAHRPYTNMLGVDSVLTRNGLSEEQRDSVYARVFKPINLNTASDPEILLIPGIGDRMLHEFKEYRPYSNIEQFRREIGKYVDEAEVARLERYVTI